MFVTSGITTASERMSTNSLWRGSMLTASAGGEEADINRVVEAFRLFLANQWGPNVYLKIEK
jgi:hypothetical protein